MARIRDLIGVEHDLETVEKALCLFADELSAPIVGAYHITCSDEVERECAESFQRLFVDLKLPEHKPRRRWPFRSTNLGARYEEGAIGVAEAHFAVPPSDARFKLLVVKVNAHVGVQSTDRGLEYGSIERYGCPSGCCGALAALIAGKDLPVIRELEALFASDDIDRVSVLRNENVVPPHQRALLTAVVNARLQARRATDDICKTPPKTPTVFLVLPAVSINRAGRDGELIVGQCGIDWTGEEPTVKYVGLGHDPAAYRVRHDGIRVAVEDDDWPSKAATI